MKKIIVLGVLTLLISYSGFTQKKRDLNTQVSISYFLPITSFNVKVIMERVDLIPGPFVKYAEEQLGVQPDFFVRGEEWNIKEIVIESVPLPDLKHIYKTNVSGDYSGIMYNLTPEGFLAGIGKHDPNSIETASYGAKKFSYIANPQMDSSIDYYRFGVRSTLKEELDSNFTMIEFEGEMRQVWDPIERHVLKDESDYVQEITEEIFNIREKRLELLSRGNATLEALEELRKLEGNYLSLFLGKRVPENVVAEFVFIPKTADESATLFRFSEQDGISSRNNVSAQPYTIEIKNAIVPADSDMQSTNSTAGVTYWVPAVVDLLLRKGSEVLIINRCVVSQLGYTKTFPLDVIANDGVRIEFYPEFGSIKSITQK